MSSRLWFRGGAVGHQCSSEVWGTDLCLRDDTRQSPSQSPGSHSWANEQVHVLVFATTDGWSEADYGRPAFRPILSYRCRGAHPPDAALSVTEFFGRCWPVASSRWCLSQSWFWQRSVAQPSWRTLMMDMICICMQHPRSKRPASRPRNTCMRMPRALRPVMICVPVTTVIRNLAGFPPNL